MKPMKLDIQMFAPDSAYPSDFVFKFVGVENPPSQMDIAFYQRHGNTSLDPQTITVNFVNGENSGTYDVAFPLRKIVIGDGTLYSATWEECVNAVTTVYIYSNDTFTGKILNDNVDNITPNSGYIANYNPDFSQVATTDEGMFTAEDNDGVTTYFRGATTNNYVKFANFWWRIIRVNGNGSIRLIYDGTTAHANGESSTDRRIGTSAFNTDIDDNAYVGYMYGTPGSTTYEATHANVNSSAIKTTLDNWYESNLSNYSDYIDKEAGFWGDRTPYSGSGTGTTTTYYAAYNRLFRNKTSSFECTNNSDLYTTTESKDGNKALQYPIGLITADEVAYAGGVWNTNNTSYYLYTNSAYWTMSPFYSGSRARVFNADSSGGLINYNVNNSYGVRPVINLRGDLFVTGTGTSTDPYDVSLPIVPATIFNGVELTNIYYNGTEISKMYCNGVLVFEKGPTVYKRRIMVGDNLKGKNIYSVFPENHWNNMEVSYGTNNYIISLENSDYGIYETLIIGPMDDIYRVASFGISDEYLYDYDVDSGTEDQNNSSFDSNSDYIVSSVVEANSSYRCLYIEDPNIRPIQVGDKIIEGTKLYFVFPDDCYKKIRSSEYIVKINTITNEELGIITYWSVSSQEINIGKITYNPNKVVNNGTTIYVWVDMLGQLYKNTSFNLVEDLSLKDLQFIGTVSEINSNSEIYNYILVDTTTLGT